MVYRVKTVIAVFKIIVSHYNLELERIRVNNF